MKHTSGVIILNREDKVLIEHPTNHDPNFWSFPKGTIDEGESEIDAAYRECLEETSFDLNKVEHTVLRELPRITYKNKRKTIKLFVIKTFEHYHDFPFNCTSMVTHNRRGEEIKPFPEVDDFKWVTFEQAYPLLHESQQRAIDSL